MADQEEADRFEETTHYYQELLKPLFAGRRVIVIGGPIVGQIELGRGLRALGTERPFLLGSIVGTGPRPKPEEAEWRSLGVQAEDPIDGIRTYEGLLSNLPAEIETALDEYDPDRNAWVIGLIVLGDVRGVAGRKRYAGRPQSWAALEDKVAIDSFWDAIGVPHAPSEVVPAEAHALRAAARRLDQAAGTVWAGDAHEGINGGGVYLRWVRDEDDARAAERFLSARCLRARVMPFLEGIPCSIHGVVFPDGVAVFRPVELITLRARNARELRYAGVATFWDPQPEDREEMRSVARRTGEGLRAAVGFRGPFGVDGILTESGFLPTELNARFGAHSLIARSLPRFPFLPVLLAAQAGEPLEFKPEMLEEVVVEAADCRRGGGGWTAIRKPLNTTETRSVVDESNSYRIARESEDSDAALLTGPGDVGGFVFFGPDPARVPRGPSLAPRVVRAFALADKELATGIGPLDTARPVR
jgi:hypothetical protein